MPNQYFYLLQLLFVVIASTSAQHILNTTNAEIESNILRFSYELEKRWLHDQNIACEDFYTFVCSKVHNNTAELLQKEAAARFGSFLQKFSEKQNLTNTLNKGELLALRFYEACHDNRTLMDLKSTLMYRYSGGWPAIEEQGAPVFKRKKPTWMHVLIAFQDRADPAYLFKQHVEVKSNRRYLHLSLSDTTRFSMSEYEEKVQNVLESYDVEAARRPLVALEVLSMERLRRAIFKGNKTEERAWNYTMFKEEAFPKLSNVMDWDNYFKKVVGKALKPSDIIIVKDFDRMQQIFFNFLQNNSLTRLLNWIILSIKAQIRNRIKYRL